MSEPLYTGHAGGRVAHDIQLITPSRPGRAVSFAGYRAVVVEPQRATGGRGALRGREQPGLDGDKGEGAVAPPPLVLGPRPNFPLGLY